MEQVVVKVQRQRDRTATPYWQSFNYAGNLNIPVTTLLERLNHQEHLMDTEGKKACPIHWSCSCEQGLCGSCAMVINEKPGLGCQVFSNDLLDEGHEIRIQPLSKFPVICDLEVDRQEMFQVMKEMELWLNKEAKVNPGENHFEYEVSQCLMCGCCLEACPNYRSGDLFAGAPVAVAAAKILEQETEEEHRDRMKKAYRKKVFRGCTKALACQKVCPMNIPIQSALSKSNQMSVWKLWKLWKLFQS